MSRVTTDTIALIIEQRIGVDLDAATRAEICKKLDELRERSWSGGAAHTRASALEMLNRQNGVNHAR